MRRVVCSAAVLHCVAVLAGEKITASSRPIAPALTQAEMFNALDLSRPDLTPVKQAIDAGDIPAAQRAFVAYLKSRTSPRWHFDWRARPPLTTRPAGLKMRAADEAARNIIATVSVRHDYGPEIDWFLNPTKNNYAEYVWQLGRHSYWNTLREAYWQTGDEKYARAFVRQLNSWIDRCPRPADSGNYRDSAWRTIECGIRMAGSWPNSFLGFLSSPSFDDASICKMVAGMVGHARHLMKYPTRGNWLTMESNGLFHVGVLLPEFKEAAAWRQTGLERLRRELDAQVYPDGAQMELSTGYHQVALHNFVAPVHLAKLNDIQLPEGYVERLERMYHYNLYAARPDLRLPDLNDAGHYDVTGSCREALEFFPNRTDFKWAASRRREGSPPSQTSYAFPWAGHLVMRSGWRSDDAYLLFDVGPFGLGHQHEDKLSFVLYAHDRELIIDPGNYPYDSSQWRKYHTNSYAHNVIHVDGLPQNRRGLGESVKVVRQPLPFDWKTDAKYDYAAGVYDDGFGPKNQKVATHRREILFVKPDYWVVIDTLRPQDDKTHLYEAFFHTDAEPNQAVIDPRTGSFRTQFERGNVAIVPAGGLEMAGRIVAGQEHPNVQGWVKCGAYEVRPAATAVYSKRAAGPTTMAYAIGPFRGQMPMIRAAESLTLPAAGGEPTDALAVKLTFADGSQQVIVRLGRPGISAEWNRHEVHDRLAVWTIEKSDDSAMLRLAVPW
jgi:hypothetical protein